MHIYAGIRTLSITCLATICPGHQKVKKTRVEEKQHWIHLYKCSMNSGNLPALLLVGKQFGVYWIWPRHHVLTWFSVDHWSHKRLRDSMVRSVWETLCTSTTNPPQRPPPHTYICIAKLWEFLKWEDCHTGFTKFTWSSKVLWESWTLLDKDSMLFWNISISPDSSFTSLCWTLPHASPVLTPSWELLSFTHIVIQSSPAESNSPGLSASWKKAAVGRQSLIHATCKNYPETWHDAQSKAGGNTGTYAWQSEVWDDHKGGQDRLRNGE